MKHLMCTELFLKSSHLLRNYHHQVISVFILFHISAQWEGEGAKTAQQGTFMDPQLTVSK